MDEVDFPEPTKVSGYLKKSLNAKDESKQSDDD